MQIKTGIYLSLFTKLIPVSTFGPLPVCLIASIHEWCDFDELQKQAKNQNAPAFQALPRSVNPSHFF